MKALPLISGGKDSIYAMYIAMQQGFEIDKFLTIVPQNPYSYMYHTPNLSITQLQAMTLKMHRIEISADRKDEMKNLKSFLMKAEEDFVVVGAIASEYQFYNILYACEEAGKKVYAPLWRKNQFKLIKDMINAGFEIMIVAVAAEGLGKEFLGKIINEEMIKTLEERWKKYGVSPVGEGGEFETCVLNAPIFQKRIAVKKGRVVWKISHGYYIIEEAELI